MDGNKPPGAICTEQSRIQEDEGEGLVSKISHLELRAPEEGAIDTEKDTESIIPSKVMDDYWVWALSPSGEKDPVESLDKVGKWMIFEDKITRDNSGLTALDRKWFMIEKMVNDDELYKAKVTTGMDNPNAQNKTNGVIIVYTKDYTDVKDVVATAKKLRAKFSDLPKYIYYKTDEATEAGLYRVRGSTNVSTYRCDQYGFVDERGSDGRSWVPVRVI